MSFTQIEILAYFRPKRAKFNCRVFNDIFLKRKDQSVCLIYHTRSLLLNKGTGKSKFDISGIEGIKIQLVFNWYRPSSPRWS